MPFASSGSLFAPNSNNITKNGIIISVGPNDTYAP